VTQSLATLKGTVNPNGANSTVYFQYSATITGLSANTTYYFQFVGTNSGGANYGGNANFTAPKN